VRLVTEQEHSVASVTRNLDIHMSVLRLWTSEYRDGKEHSFPGKGHLKPDDDELRRLKRRNAELEEEIAILKRLWPSSQGPR
jgi:transposase